MGLLYFVILFPSLVKFLGSSVYLFVFIKPYRSPLLKQAALSFSFNTVFFIQTDLFVVDVIVAEHPANLEETK